MAKRTKVYHDLLGKDIGTLHVSERLDSGEIYHGTLWKCKCKCGNECIRSSFQLEHGVRSCGCIRPAGARNLRSKDWTGVRNGRITVLYKNTDIPPNYGSYYWHCKCDCGKEFDTLSANILKTMSCGCYRAERISETKRVDITGKRSGHLVAIKPTGNHIGSFLEWECRCDCGNVVYLPVTKISQGSQLTCGKEDCPYLHQIRVNSATVWKTADEKKIVEKYHGMMNRCYNPNDVKSYKDYGGRGIYVCPEWKGNIKAFVDWALEHGYKPGLTIDRIDVNGPYSPENCRWVDMKAQANNKRTNHYLEVCGQVQTVKQWADQLPITESALRQMLSDKGDGPAIQRLSELYRNRRAAGREQRREIAEQLANGNIRDKFLDEMYGISRST